MNTNPKLDAAVSALEGAAIAKLQEWIRLPSVRTDDGSGNAPFGADVRRMLDKALEDIAALGMTPRDIDGYACDAEIGEGDDVIGILAHLDVVPEGTGWVHDPYGAEIVDNHMYGRGTSDDKGPAVAALYAMRAVMDAGISLKRRVRIILGCDEESGMDDIAYYDKKIGLPAKGFSPDATFPVINTEKGILQMVASGAWAGNGGDYTLLSIQSGTRPNVVPNTATARLSGNADALAATVAAAAKTLQIDYDLANEGDISTLVVKGVSAHASMPWDGKNAAGALLCLLAEIGVGGSNMASLRDAIGLDSDGTGLGIAGEDKVSGPLTCNLGLLSYDGTTFSVTLDCRYPVFFADKQITRFASLRLAACGLTLAPGHASPPHHVPETSFVVKSLLDVYASITGRDAQPISIGGGTYARAMQEAVAFGSLFPDEPELAHQADESIDLTNFALTIKIFAYAIVALAGA